MRYQFSPIEKATAVGEDDIVNPSLKNLCWLLFVTVWLSFHQKPSKLLISRLDK